MNIGNLPLDGPRPRRSDALRSSRQVGRLGPPEELKPNPSTGATGPTTPSTHASSDRVIYGLGQIMQGMHE